MLNLPLEEDDKLIEKQYIYKIAKINGYGEKFVDKIIYKHKKKLDLARLTTLQRIKNEMKYISVPYCPTLTKKFKNIFKRNNLKLVTKSKSTLKSIICNYKDVFPNTEKSGIYAEKCKTCDFIYIGQSSRSIITRHNEHKTAVNDRNSSHQSSVADHAHNLSHQIELSKFKVVKTVNNENLLNSWESYFISNSQMPLMNQQPPIIKSKLYKYCDKPNINFS